MAHTVNPLNENNTENEQSLSGNSKNDYKNRRSLILLLVVFIVPILLAKLALDNQWLSLGVTNKGQLLTQALTTDELGIAQQIPDKKWLIIYRLPNSCSEACLHSIEAVHNSYVAIGKDRPRVAAVLIKGDALSKEESQQLSSSQWHVLNLTAQIEAVLPEPQVFIADPLGNIILTHKVPMQTQQQADFGKAILADMKKLLKYSKVG